RIEPGHRGRGPPRRRTLPPRQRGPLAPAERAGLDRHRGQLDRLRVAALLRGGRARVLQPDGSRPPSGRRRARRGAPLPGARRDPALAGRARRIAAEAIGRLDFTGTEVARLAAPLNVDNFEGIEVLRGPKGETRVLLISDDNDCVK